MVASTPARAARPGQFPFVRGSGRRWSIEERFDPPEQFVADALAAGYRHLDTAAVAEARAATVGRDRWLLTLGEDGGPHGWLDTEESRSVGATKDGERKSSSAGSEAVGHESGRRIVSVLGKKKDDLQAVIAALKGEDFGIPLQFSNFRD